MKQQITSGELRRAIYLNTQLEFWVDASQSPSETKNSIE